MSSQVLIVSGLPCTGKSTIAEGLSKHFQFPIFSVDPIESSIIQSGIPRSFETGLAAYLVVQTLAAEQLKLGQSVVIDAVSPVIEARDMWQSLSDTYQAQQIIIECTLDPQIHQERLQARVRNLFGIPEVTWDTVLQTREYYLAWDRERLILDTSKPLPELIASSISYVTTHSKTS